MGEEKHDGLAIPGHIVLAHEPAFTLGELRVDPALRQIEHQGRSETLEPRVMQVLVALARADGRIVTRDELIAWCWGGRIVGEDAINRAISRLRQVASETGGGSFGIETITKVGYRLVKKPASTRSDVDFVATPSARPIMSRRIWMAAAGSVAAGTVGVGLLWQKPWRHRPDPEAVELVRRGDLAQRASRPDQTRQAVTYFERAVRLDPHYATAWGMLALSYTHSLDGFSEAQLAGLPGRIRSAASRALQLDPDNPDAQLALACIPPYFRNWTRLEPELRRIRDQYPEHWLANGRLAILYYQVGRLLEGAALHQRVIAKDPLIPGPYAFAASALSNAGHFQEADGLFRDAADRWPANPFIWYARYDHLLFSGRAGSAASLVMDPEARPSGMAEEEVDLFLRLARAVDGREAGAIEAAIRDQLEMTLTDVRTVTFAAPVFSLFGRLDLAFESMERYFFDRGSFGPPAPIGPMTRRYTDFLFSRPMAAARADPRFAKLTRELGLDAYWGARGMIAPSFSA
jgi:DNA-binding winged helix-turn-helix (wHTH) protein